MHQISVEFKKSYNSVKSEILRNILIQFGTFLKIVTELIPLKIVTELIPLKIVTELIPLKIVTELIPLKMVTELIPLKIVTELSHSGKNKAQSG